MTSQIKTTSVNVRGTELKLMAYTRSLELCARMNYETENLDFIDSIEPGKVLYDLGACEGRFSIYAALKGIKVFSFEPEQRNFKVLSENIALNNLGTKLTALNYAIGATDAMGILKIGQPWEGGHQKVVEHGEIRNDLNFDFKENQQIKITSLDAIVASKKYPAPDYLKIDIDGSEMPFMQGAEKTLGSVNLKGLIFELNKQDPNYDTIISRLQSFGFKQTEEYPVPNEPSLFNIIFRK